MNMNNVLRSFAVTVLAFFGSAEARQANIHTQGITQSGVVIESVKKDSQAEKAGLRPGDLLLSHIFIDKTVPIQSPFDLFQLEIELPARGKVMIEGTRGGNGSS